MKKKYINYYSVLIVGCFFLYLTWALYIPYNQAPDEYLRYMIPKFIYQHGYLPSGWNPEIRDPNWGISYAFTPITSYVFSAVFMKIASIFSTSDYVLLSAARFTSVCFSTGTVYLCSKICKKIFDDNVAKLFLAMIALWPEFIFISSYVNNDSIGIFSVALVIYTMLNAEENHWNVKSCIWLGIAVGVDLISYYNTYGIIVIAFLYAVFSVIKDKEIEQKFKNIVLKSLVVLGAALLISGGWFARNYVLYGGDILGMSSSAKCSELYAIDALKPSNRATPYKQHMTLKNMLIDQKWISSSVKSYIGMFGYMNVPLQKYHYCIYGFISFVGIVGNLLRIPSARKMRKKMDRFDFAMIGMCLITVGLSVYYSFFNDFQAQGRYCLPMHISFCYLITFGIMKVGGYIFSKKNGYFYTFISLLLLIVAIGSTVNCVFSTYG